MNPIQPGNDTVGYPSGTDALQHGMRSLTPIEIAAVAGGPEGTVGSGLSPP